MPRVSRARFSGISLVKDLRRRTRDPASILIWVGIPVMLGALMSMIAGDSGAAPRAKVLLADLDDSFLSRLLANAGGGGDRMPFEIESVELEVGRERIEAADASALLVLPDGFAEGVLKDEPVVLELVTNPSQRIGPEMVRSALEIMVEAVFYAHRLLGDELRELAEGPPEGQDFFEDARIAAISARINQRMQGAGETLFPVVLKLVIEAEEEEPEQGIDLGAIFIPGLLLMSLIFIAQGMSDDIWHEKDQGTLRRALASPPGLAPFLAGKIGAGAVVMGAVALVGLGVCAVGFDMNWSVLPAGTLWCTFAGVSLYCLFLVVQLIATSQRGASVVSMSVLFPLMMIGGSFFPFEAMPEWMTRIGRWTPNGSAVLILKSMDGLPAFSARSRGFTSDEIQLA